MKSLPFTESYLISLVSRPDRYNVMRHQIDKFGWDIKDHRTVKHPCCNEIFNRGVGCLNTSMVPPRRLCRRLPPSHRRGWHKNHDFSKKRPERKDIS